MNNLKKSIILLVAAFFLTTGIIAANHFHSENEKNCKDKDHCSICSFVFAISNSNLISFFFLITLSVVLEKVIYRKNFSFLGNFYFLPPSHAPPVS